MAKSSLWEGREDPGSSPAACDHAQRPCPASTGRQGWAQSLCGPYQCCLRRKAFGACTPRADPWRAPRPRVGPEPWHWSALAAVSETAVPRSSHPRLRRSLPPRALPPPGRRARTRARRRDVRKEVRRRRSRLGGRGQRGGAVSLSSRCLSSTSPEGLAF